MRSGKGMAFILAALLASALFALPAAAQWPEDSVLFPITDASQYYVETGTANPAATIGAIGSDGAWMNVEILSDGSAVLTKAADSPCAWPKIHTIETLDIDDLPLVVLKDTPYLYYDFTVENCEWMLSLGLNNVFFKMAKEICRVEGTKQLATVDHDGPAGTYKGRVDMEEYLKELGYDMGAYAMDYTGACFFVVDPGVRGRITINAIYFGGEYDTDGPPKPPAAEVPTEPPVEETEPPTEPPVEETEPPTEPPVEETEPPTEPPVTKTEPPAATDPTPSETATPDAAPKNDFDYFGLEPWQFFAAIGGAALIAGAAAVMLIIKSKKKGKKS